MTAIKFLLIGDAGVGKSKLLDIYLRKLNLGKAFHYHRINQRHYDIDVIEILSFDQLRQCYNFYYQNQEDIIISVMCFSVADRKTLGTLRREWIPEVLKIDKNTEMFLMGLQCDLREQFLTKLTQNCFSQADGMQVCLYYENLHYVECSSQKLASVNEAFETMLEIIFYKNIQKKLEEQILKLYATMQIKFEFYGPVMWENEKGNQTESKQGISKDDMESEAEAVNEVEIEMKLEQGILNNEAENVIESEDDETEFEQVILRNRRVSEVIHFEDETKNRTEMVATLLQDSTEFELMSLKDETENEMEPEAEAAVWTYDTENEMESLIINYETYLEEAIFKDESQSETESDADILHDDTEFETVIVRDKTETRDSGIVVTEV